MHQIWTLLQLPAKYRQPEVTDLDSPSFINKYILRLQIPVRDSSLMTVMHPAQNLIEILSGYLLLEPALIYRENRPKGTKKMLTFDNIEEISSLDELEDEVDLGVARQDFLQFYYIPMIDHLHHRDVSIG